MTRVILSEPLVLGGYAYPAGEPVEIEPSSVAERLCLNGKAVPADVRTANALAKITLGDAVVLPPDELAERAAKPSKRN